MAWGCGGSDGTDLLSDAATGNDGQIVNDAAGNDAGTDGNVVPDSGLTCTAPMANCSGKASDGCNIDTSTDNQNCGGCGSVCNTQCKAGVCPLFTADAGAPQNVGDFACLTVDATNVYWGTGLTSGNGGGVWKVALNGGNPSLLIGAQDRPHGMVSDGTNLYYANYGGAPNVGSIQKIPLGGGAPTPIAITQPFPLDVAVDATNVYWTNQGDGTVWKSSKTVPAPVKIANGGGQGHAQYLRIDTTFAYYTDGVGGAVLRVPLDGSALTPAVVTKAPGPRYIAIDSTTAYFGSSSNGGAAMLSIPLNANNGAAAQILPNLGSITGVATDGTNVWYAIPQTNGQNTGSINRATKAGVGATPLAKAQNFPGCVAIDSKSVYWINLGGGLISKTGK
jgi:hypothetical protein